MRICITRSEKFSYSETFIRDQLTVFKELAEVYPIHTSRLPERAEDGSLLFSWPFWILHKIFKFITGQRDNYFSNQALRKYFSDNHIDIVLSNYGLTAAHLLPACKAANIPLIVIFHGHDASDQRIINQYRKRYTELFAYAIHIIAVSNEMRNSLINLGANADKIQVIPCGVDTEKFQLSATEKEKLFLAVGRFVYKKGPLHTIRAFHEVWKKYPDTRMVMAGAHTGLYTACKKLTAALDMEGVITFPGVLPHSEVSKLMTKTFAFVQHSLTAPNGDKEGTPVGILEAAASGLPVVSTLHGGIPEAVIHGKTGFLVAEGDVTAMAQSMIALLENESIATSMHTEARKHITANYEQKKQIMKLYALAREASDQIKKR